MFKIWHLPKNESSNLWHEKISKFLAFKFDGLSLHAGFALKWAAHGSGAYEGTASGLAGKNTNLALARAVGIFQKY